MNSVLRTEKKYLIGVDESARKSRKLEQVMMSDPHNTPHGYMVRPLYFDTPYDSDFFDKTAGIELRRKIRLRIYSTDCDFAMLEISSFLFSLQKSFADACIPGKFRVLLRP